MKKGQLLILFIFCIVIGIAGLMVKKKSQQNWKKQDTDIGKKVLSDFPLNEIRRIQITSGKNSVELAKESAGMWVARSSFSYYADFTKVADFLKKIAEIGILQNIEIEENDFGRLELETGKESGDKNGIEVNCFDETDKSIAKIIFGKQHMRKSQGKRNPYGGGGESPDGRYIYIPHTKTVALVGEPFSTINDGSSDQWIDKTFIKVDKVKKAIRINENSVLWTVFREEEGNSLELLEEIESDEKIIKSKLNGIDSALRYPSFNSVADPSITDEVHGFLDGKQFVLEDFDGFTYTVSIGSKTDKDEYPIRFNIGYAEPDLPSPPEDEKEEDKEKRENEFKELIAKNNKKFKSMVDRYTKWTYLVSSYTVENMLLEKNDLIEKKEKPSSEDKNSSVETGKLKEIPKNLNSEPEPNDTSSQILGESASQEKAESKELKEGSGTQ